jgi:hypothetical protein
MVRKFRANGPGAIAVLQALGAQKVRTGDVKFVDYLDFWERFEVERRVYGKALQIVNDYSTDVNNNKRTYDDSDVEAEGTSYEESKRKRDNKRRAERKRKREAERAIQREKAARKDRHGDSTGNGDGSDGEETTQGNICGRYHGGSCKLKHHPDANNTTDAWTDSAAGKRWAAKGKKCVEFHRLLNGKPWRYAPSGKKDQKKKGNRSELMYRYDHLYAFEHDLEYTLPCRVGLVDSSKSLNARMLIDTGALQSNYVSVKTAAWLQGLQVRRQLVDSKREEARESCSCTRSSSNVECDLCNSDSKKSINNNKSLLFESGGTAMHLVQGHTTLNTIGSSRLRRRYRISKTKTGKSITALRRSHRRENLLSLVAKRTKVCSGINGMCTESPGEVQFILTYFDSATQYEESIPVTAKILDTPYDFILGRPDIIRHNILQRIGDHLYVKSNDQEPLRPWRASHDEFVPKGKLVVRKSILCTERMTF